ncbi:class I SAM-dependent methyltransferase [Gordonia sp. CPCC 205333]|uniref:class I SAM-dependent methyltransferase n=1 Tax=Gordonia sp. CPCC 205333 TaxID=3140790 RepID=UPI003AF3E735
MTTTQQRGFNGLITRFFDVAAKAYDLGPLQRVVYRPPHDDVLAQLRKHGVGSVADIGCGTGIFTTRIQQELGLDTVYGIDASRGMLARGRARTDKVDWREGPAEALPLPDASVDAVITTTAFHFFDQPRALAEYSRVLKPNGIIAISAINPKGFLVRPMQRITLLPIIPAHAASPSQMCEMITARGFEIVEQRPIKRPLYSRLVPDVLTVARIR